ncbi:hypothetical protein V6Z11_D05G193000 [Gossypium hirsutum]
MASSICFLHVSTNTHSFFMIHEKLINMRKRQDIHSRSPVRILETTSIPQLLGEDRGLVHGIQLAGSGH